MLSQLKCQTQKKLPEFGINRTIDMPIVLCEVNVKV
jgi:hypothetical protein